MFEKAMPKVAQEYRREDGTCERKWPKVANKRTKAQQKS